MGLHQLVGGGSGPGYRLVGNSKMSTNSNNKAFMWDKCSHLMLCLHLMEPRSGQLTSSWKVRTTSDLQRVVPWGSSSSGLWLALGARLQREGVVEVDWKGPIENGFTRMRAHNWDRLKHRDRSIHKESACQLHDAKKSQHRLLHKGSTSAEPLCIKIFETLINKQSNLRYADVKLVF